MTAPAMSGCLYYVIIVDDYSCKTCFISWRLWVKLSTFIDKQMGPHICALRSDNDGEFNSHHFKDLCRETWIKRELMVPYNPQQNGVAERKNRPICEAAKAIMHDLDLPSSIWAEAVGTTVYIQNRCPHFILGDKTPKEKFTGVKPTVDHLRIFGCPVYILLIF